MSAAWDDLSPGRWWRTLRHVRAEHILARARRFGRSPRPDHRPAPELRPVTRALVAPYSWPKAFEAPDRFTFLNETRRVTGARDWDRPDWPRLWTYHIHYFDDLAGAEPSDVGLRSLMSRWMDENPPGLGPGWEPYPLSLRSVNWIRWSLSGADLPRGAVQSLAVQLRSLSRSLERHLGVDHLLANAKALVIGGLFFRGPEADRWRRLGDGLVQREIAGQVLADGGHCMRSPMYHGLVLLDLLDLVNVHRSYGLDVPELVTESADRMRRWLRTMQHTDGEIPLFNDSALDRSPRCAGVEEYAGRVGLPELGPPASAPALTVLPDTGYIRADLGAARLFIDVAPLGPAHNPGHDHADAFTFELGLFGERVIVDPGTSTYERGPIRDEERGTASHNTLCVDGGDSSEVWASHRVGRRARIVELAVEDAEEFISVAASHDGYRALPGGGIVHRRTWRLDREGLLIEDELQGQGAHRAFLSFLFHPKVGVSLVSPHRIRIDLSEQRQAWLLLDPTLDGLIEPAAYAERFGRRDTTVRVRGSWKGSTPVRFRTRLFWGEGVPDEGPGLGSVIQGRAYDGE